MAINLLYYIQDIAYNKNKLKIHNKIKNLPLGQISLILSLKFKIQIFLKKDLP